MIIINKRIKVNNELMENLSRVASWTKSELSAQTQTKSGTLLDFLITFVNYILLFIPDSILHFLNNAI